MDIISRGNYLPESSSTSVVPSAAGLGETLDIGRDIGVAVTDYRTPRGAFEGDIPHVSVTFD